MKNIKNRIFVFLVIASMAFSFCACGSSNNDEVKAGKNQKLVTVMVSSIQGNEMSYMEITESETTSSSNSSKESSSETVTTNSNSGQQNNNSNLNGNNSSNSENMTPPSDAQGGNPPNKKSTKGNFQTTGDLQTTYIPVGTKVHTTTDTVTTFARISSGDKLKLLMEKNSKNKYLIVEIWME